MSSGNVTADGAPPTAFASSPVPSFGCSAPASATAVEGDGALVAFVQLLQLFPELDGAGAGASSFLYSLWRDPSIAPYLAQTWGYTQQSFFPAGSGIQAG